MCRAAPAHAWWPVCHASGPGLVRGLRPHWFQPPQLTDGGEGSQGVTG